MGSYQPNMSGSLPVPQHQYGFQLPVLKLALSYHFESHIWTLLWTFWNGEELKRYRMDGLGGGIHLLLAIFVMPVVMFLLADEVAKLYEEEGLPAPITAVWGLWFLLPLIGHIIWYIRIQSALNGFWQARGATSSPGLT